MTGDRRLLVLVNRAAGSAQEGQLDEVCRALSSRSDSGIEVRDPAPAEYAETVASAVGRDVVVVGGDGSLHRLLQEISDQDLLARVGAVGLVPLGTGNDLARGAGLPLEPLEAVPVAVGGTARARSLLLEESGEVVANAVHCGVAAEATARAADVKGRLGRAAYVWGALRAGVTSRGWHLRVSVDGTTVVDGSDRVLMVSAVLGSTVGGGTPIVPRSQDGELVTVVVACGTSAWARVGFARALRRGRHAEREDVLVVSGREVQVEAVDPRDAFRANTDGEVSDERYLSRRWRLQQHVWRLRVPAD